MKFKLVKGAGPHKVGGRVYKAGEIVENDANLVRLFPGKFEQVEGPAPEAGEPAASETRTPFDTELTRKAQPGVLEELPPEEQLGAEEVPGEEEELADEDGPKTRRVARTASAHARTTGRKTSRR